MGRIRLNGLAICVCRSGRYDFQPGICILSTRTEVQLPTIQVTSMAKYIPCKACASSASETAEECLGHSPEEKLGPWHRSRSLKGEQLASDVAWLRERASEWATVPPVAMALRQAADDMALRYLRADDRARPGRRGVLGAPVRAIIISDAEAKALLDRLELQAMREAHHWPAGRPDSAEVNGAHRAFHFVVCRWLQEMGAEVTPR